MYVVFQSGNNRCAWVRGLTINFWNYGFPQTFKSCNVKKKQSTHHCTLFSHNNCQDSFQKHFLLQCRVLYGYLQFELKVSYISYFYQEVCELIDTLVDNSYPISYFNKTPSEFENSENFLKKILKSLKFIRSCL